MRDEMRDGPIREIGVYWMLELVSCTARFVVFLQVRRYDFARFHGWEHTPGPARPV